MLQETAVGVFLDLTNMFHWQEVLRWKFRIEDVIQQLYAITATKDMRVYYGFNERDPANSKGFHKRIRATGAILVQKPMKWIKREIRNEMFFKQTTLNSLHPAAFGKVAELVSYFRQSGLVIEEPKCNFDVEMTMDLLDAIDKISAVIIFSGYSDLKAPLERLKVRGKRIYICGVRGRVAQELINLCDGYINFGAWYRGTRRYTKAKIPLVAGPRV